LYNHQLNPVQVNTNTEVCEVVFICTYKYECITHAHVPLKACAVVKHANSAS